MRFSRFSFTALVFFVLLCSLSSVEGGTCRLRQFSGRLALIVDATANSNSDIEECSQNVPSIAWDVASRILSKADHLEIALVVFNTRTVMFLQNWTEIRDNNQLHLTEQRLRSGLEKFFASRQGELVKPALSPKRKLTTALFLITQQIHDWLSFPDSTRHVALLLSPGNVVNRFDSNSAVLDTFNTMFKTMAMNFNGRSGPHRSNYFLRRALLKDQDDVYENNGNSLEIIAKNLALHQVDSAECQKHCQKGSECQLNLICGHENICSCRPNQALAPHGGICHTPWQGFCNVSQTCPPSGVCINGLCQLRLPEILCPRKCGGFEDKECPKTMFCDRSGGGHCKYAPLEQEKLKTKIEQSLAEEGRGKGDFWAKKARNYVPWIVVFLVLFAIIAALIYLFLLLQRTRQQTLTKADVRQSMRRITATFSRGAQRLRTFSREANRRIRKSFVG